MLQNFTRASDVQVSDEIKDIQAAFMNKVYGWMSIALVVTGLVAFWAANTQAVIDFVFAGRFTFYALIIAEFGLVIWLSRRIDTMTPLTAMLGFMAYSALNGLTFSVIFLAYTTESITTTFLITAGTFGVMSAYGYITKRDLTSMGNLAGMALVGLIIAMVVNWFVQSPMMGYIISGIGVLVFTALTAYDTQKIKNMGVAGMGEEVEAKGAIMGALRLYLDFINLFLFLLRFVGGRD